MRTSDGSYMMKVGGGFGVRRVPTDDLQLALRVDTLKEALRQCDCKRNRTVAAQWGEHLNAVEIEVPPVTLVDPS